MANRITWLPSADSDIASYNIQWAVTNTGSWAALTGVIHDITGTNYDTSTGQFFYVDYAGDQTTWYRLQSVDALAQTSSFSLPFQATYAESEIGYATVSELKQYLGITSTADDALMTRLLETATTWIDRQIGRSLAAESHTEYRSGDGRQTMVLRQPDAYDVTSVTIDGETIPEATGSTDDGWFLMDNTVQLRSYVFTCGKKNVTLVYSAGLQNIPADIKQAAIEVAANLYKQRVRVGEISRTIAGENVSFQVLSVPITVQATLDSYKRIY